MCVIYAHWHTTTCNLKCTLARGVAPTAVIRRGVVQTGRRLQCHRAQPPFAIVLQQSSARRLLVALEHAIRNLLHQPLRVWVRVRIRVRVRVGVRARVRVRVRAKARARARVRAKARARVGVRVRVTCSTNHSGLVESKG